MPKVLHTSIKLINETVTVRYFEIPDATFKTEEKSTALSLPEITMSEYLSPFVEGFISHNLPAISAILVYGLFITSVIHLTKGVVQHVYLATWVMFVMPVIYEVRSVKGGARRNVISLRVLILVSGGALAIYPALQPVLSWQKYGVVT